MAKSKEFKFAVTSSHKLGVKLGHSESGSVVLSEVDNGSMAERLGLHKGDKVLRVDEISTNNMDKVGVAELMKVASRPMVLIIERTGADDEGSLEPPLDRAGENTATFLSLSRGRGTPLDTGTGGEPPKSPGGSVQRKPNVRV